MDDGPIRHALTLPALYLIGWTVLFFVTALAVYRRDEGVRYR